jgi:SecD/SecF fusion protein
MRNRNLILFLAGLFTLFSFYYINFSFVSNDIQRQANESATVNGQMDVNKKQSYLDSLYTSEEPVYNFLGMVPYTYKEVKEMELALGLDLQGGMHVTVEVSPINILKSLAGMKAADTRVVQALQKANEQQKNSGKNYQELFYAAFIEIAGPNQLQSIFASSENAQIINAGSSDKEVQDYVNEKIDIAVLNAYEVLRNRIDQFGAIQPNLQRIAGTGRIQIELPGVENPQRVRDLIQRTAKLEFYNVYFRQELNASLISMNTYLLAKEKALPKDSILKQDNKEEELLMGNQDTTKAVASADTTAKKDTAQQDMENSLSSFFTMIAPLEDGQPNPYNFEYYEKDTAKVNRILADPEVKRLLPSDLSFMWARKPEKEKLELVPVKLGPAGKPILTGDVVTSARSSVAQGGKGYEVSMTMNVKGAQEWNRITTSAATDRRRIAIVMDNRVYSAPSVNEPIPGGQSQITGNFNSADAADLANILNAGKLPAPVRIVEEVIVGPSLGKEAIFNGLSSLGFGLLIVIVLMVMYYNKGGMIANLALVFNVLFTFGFLASLNSVLTLPGLAGIVLSLGMSIDANVLIFERIKEELRAGKSLATAIELGYDKAFSSIFDSNITTVMVGAILFVMGSGLVKGFATTLIIGVMCSFFTAVFISKVIVLFMVRNKDEKAISFSTALSKNLFNNINFQIIDKRKFAYVFSSAVIILGIVATILNGGLNLGVDFKGGRSFIVEFPQAQVASDIKAGLVDGFEGKGTEVKTYGSDKVMKITTSFLVDDETAEGDQRVEAALSAGLAKAGAKEFKLLSVNKVGATIADDILNSSWKAIILSLIGIFIYVLFRFRRWQFSLGGVVALFHDTMITLAIFSILNLLGISFEIDQVMVAALLTIVGFSINDTVIVFDRVREFSREYSKMDMASMLNGAINSTLSRTIMTTVTVLVSVVILLLFGGETLRGFSLALLIGVVFGSYSTIFIAVPMVLDIRTKKDKDVDAVIVSKK